ncbi:hypothetical protein LMTR13_09895 [Bradyrhizobium icense]|uniref:TIGR03016 family PEP-CTERM system-associated outer membrane protein n=2 Tax=Bradyrhizobium icense TaxID=1274631 RepID=A0A1B1UCD9_9BRAD|nr:hypothetical protein LMTR13_09895 [Bradyrhizobium icense]
MAPSVAFAFDWSIKASETETVELNSNQFLRSSPAGSVGSYTTLSADAQARTPTSKFNFSGDGSYKKYWGPGVVGTASEFLNYGFKARYEVQEKTRFDREYVEASWRQQSTALALLNDLGVSVPTSGFIDRLTATGGIDRSITALDTVSLFATSSRTSYQPSSGGGTPFTDTLARGNWRRSLSSVTAINLSSEYELLEYDNAFNTQVQIFRDQAGFDATLSAVLSFRANAGVAYLVTDRGVSSSAFGGTTSATPVSSSVLDWIGDAVLTYRMLKSTTLSVIASQSVGPSVVGSLFKRDSISASLSHSINSRSTLTLSASGNRQIATTTTDYASASATYSYNLTREWGTSLTYRYLHRFASTGTAIFDPITGTPTVSGTGPADSHSLMFVVTHNWTVLPSGN